MTRERRHHEYRRLVAGFILAKMEELAERMRGNDLFGHANLLSADDHLVDAKFRPIVRHAGIGKQLHRCRRAPHQRSILDQRPWLGQHAAEKLGPQSNRGEYVAVYLVSGVEHIASNLPAPALGKFQTVEAVPISIDPKAKSSHPKPFVISRVYLYCQSVRQGCRRSPPPSIATIGGNVSKLG